MIYAVIAVCMSLSMLLSWWASRKFTSPRLKPFFFLVVSVFGVFLIPVLVELLTVLDRRQSILAALREEVWTATCGVAAMAYV